MAYWTWSRGVWVLMAIVPVIKTECDVQLSCDFEQGMCSWTQAESNTVDWKRKQGTTIPCAGPNQDHTNNNESGFYVYIEPSNIQNQISRIVSPVVKGRKLVHLWYHMQYVIDAFISVKILVNGVGKSPLFYEYGNQGDQWKHSTVVIEEDWEYKIEIFGSTGTSSCGAVAIDDVIVEDFIVTKHYSELFRNMKPSREPFRTFPGHHGISCATRCTEFHPCTYFTTHVTGHCSLYHGEDVTNVLPGDGTTIWRRDIVC
ncbi:hypothetical protein SNE40_022383 [Patella caerulea]|uniref:MAM domain-containing protein n=1 Tax=Patella caerulea TaxID=87958 RepID=A0AAN8FWA4_PATCE